jgi:hypothetical protein
LSQCRDKNARIKLAIAKQEAEAGIAVITAKTAERCSRHQAIPATVVIPAVNRGGYFG